MQHNNPAYEICSPKNSPPGQQAATLNLPLQLRGLAVDNSYYAAATFTSQEKVYEEIA